VLDPPQNRRVRQTNAAFPHHHHQIAIAQLETQVPTHAQHYDLPVEMSDATLNATGFATLFATEKNLPVLRGVPPLTNTTAHRANDGSAKSTTNFAKLPSFALSTDLV
jgi:hypothetical protein